MVVGQDTFPTMHPVPGFRLGTTSAGIKKAGRKDLVVMEIAPGSTVAGVFTRNAFCAAPVQIAKAHLQKNTSRFWVVNTGNANAGTGVEGLRRTNLICEQVAGLGDVSAAEVLPFSTGVIGEPLPVEKIIGALPLSFAVLAPDGWRDAAEGIMTTDTRPKGASRQLEIDGRTVVISGIAKGAGMIKPNMATMLAFIATDAGVEQPLLQRLISEAMSSSFNRITIDGDTSTNDAVVIAATGQSGAIIKEDTEAYVAFVAVLREVAMELAHAILRDGEGATKFVAIEVSGGATSQESLSVAYAVAESPLVKTALFASDPNWGRILAAVGRAGVEDLAVENVCVRLDDVLVVENGGRAESYTEEAGQAVMNKDEITIRIDLGRGDCMETVWTTDLSHEYVRINAEYRS